MTQDPILQKSDPVWALGTWRRSWSADLRDNTDVKTHKGMEGQDCLMIKKQNNFKRVSIDW